jgi:predicted DNA-binding transcriptional regulator AlpA
MAEQLIDVRELAEALSVPVSWVYSRTRQKGTDTIPHLKLGKYRRFRLCEVIAYLEKQQNEQE